LCVFRLWIIGFSSPEFSSTDNPIAHHPSAFVRCLTFLYLPIFHLLLLALPYNLCFDWSMDAIAPVESLFDSRFLFALLCYAVLVLGTFRLIASLELFSSASPISESECRCESRSPSPKFDINANIIRHRRRTRATNLNDGRHQSFEQSEPKCNTMSNGSDELSESAQWLVGIAFLAAPHVPASNLFVYVGFVAAERILYLPSVGFCILVTLAIDRFYKWARIGQRTRMSVLVLCVCLLLAHTVRLLNRNAEWSDEEALYRSAVLINPAKAYANLGNVLSRKGQKEEAQHAYRIALEHRPNMADTHYNLGILYQDANDFERAISSYRIAIIYRPTLASAYLNLGLCLWRQEKHTLAEEVFGHCFVLDSSRLRNPRGHRSAQVACAYNLGVMLARLSRHREAIVAYQRALELMEENYEGAASVLNMMGESLSQNGHLDKAEHYFKRALEVAPSHIPAYLTFSQLRFVMSI
uniref:dolichyl-phosphate-mannose--protein mannosyltransferase n=1 Tax=Toxocara canis TaxID=6265 RepID=A0A183V375_TOXCA